jgi:hypothetical protein
MPTKPTTDQLQQSIHVICKVIGQIPCFQLYEKYVTQRFGTSESDISLEAITHNAVLDSALISLRCFDEFFGSGRRRDDIRADDFPGVSMHPFLPPDEAKAIHKYLAHITLTRSDIVTKPWFLDDMVIIGLQHGVKFLSTIEINFPPNTEAVRTELRGVRDMARLLSAKIATRRETNVP